nr:immunoglobulin light chain junction region [Macaca mulatta]MOV75414.1 immunoglobulin light chain junction region [Macaca mulatta]MOV76506.1 immunoglobulin light chain junction region [Macaca mulatta]MOV77021.1 immunoglobulin light chain junction region [Macaca mulatta]MOW61808.1 immunoglobulin light chain junction region [Macaca mulatta]
CQKYSSSPYSF